MIIIGTYVERFGEDNPSGFGQDREVGKILGVVGRQVVDDGAVVIGVLVRGRHTQNVGPDVRVLFHVLHVFLRNSFD